MCLFFSLNATFNRMAVCHYFEHITCARDLKNKPVNSDHGSRTSCFCFPTKMLHLNAPLFPLKCSVSPKNKQTNQQKKTKQNKKQEQKKRNNNSNNKKLIKTALYTN